MKHNSFFLTRWWGSLELQSRLFLVYTSLFLFSAMALSLFLFSNTSMVALNNRTKVVFEQNRQIYNLDDMVQQYELALNQYELNASGLAWVEMEVQSSQIDEAVSTLRPFLSEEDQADLDQFATYKQQLAELFKQVAEAVDREDWESVVEIDIDAYEVLAPMEEHLAVIYERGIDELDKVWDAVALFDILTIAGVLLTLPVFLFLASIAAYVIYVQINQPIGQLTQAANHVLDGKWNRTELEKLALRSDEIGVIAKEFIDMVGAVEQRSFQLKQEAEEIRAKIR